MTTDQTVFPLDNNTDLLLLDDEDDLRNVATIDQGHRFLNFSRRIAESASMRRPVDIQLGIACGKDLIFSRSLLDKKKVPLLHHHKAIREHNKDDDEGARQTDKEEVLPLEGKKKSLPPLPPKMQENVKGVNKKNPSSKKELNGGNKALVEMSMNQSKRNSSGLLDRLVADVLKHIESCPDQTAYSIDLDKLKPKLQAYTLTRPKVQ
ncbi:hypothetical protein K501DRAFT_309225 [Backusella circina FSU 941]|nr:hypothetical protein K501DRAFT_309225 [Backusella circina FSU 941]